MNMTQPAFASVQSKVDVTKERVQHLLVGLFENNYSPWLIKIKNKNLAPNLTFDDFTENGKMQNPDQYFHWSQIIPVTEGCSLTLVIENPYSDGEKTIQFVLDIPAIQKGLEVMANKYPKHWIDFILENEDAITCDVFGQCVVYGEDVFN